RGVRANPVPAWILERLDGAWIGGHALIGALLEACLRYGVDVRTSAVATQLVAGEAGVGSLVVESGGEPYTVAVRNGVVLASGGFEGADELTAKYLGAGIGIHVSPAGHDGGALAMAATVNAGLVATGTA